MPHIFIPPRHNHHGNHHTSEGRRTHRKKKAARWRPTKEEKSRPPQTHRTCRPGSSEERRVLDALEKFWKIRAAAHGRSHGGRA